MLGERAARTVVTVTYKGVILNSEVLVAIIAALVRMKNMPMHGKQSLKTLVLQERQLDSIPVAKADLKGLQRELKSFGIDFAIRKSLSEPDEYKIYFKAMDVAQLQNALEDYTAKSFKKANKQKTSIKERMEAAKIKSQEINKERLQQNMVRQKTKGVEER